MRYAVGGMELQTVTAIVRTLHVAEAVAAGLVRESAWFAVEPRPNDHYAFTVKTDRKRTLASYIAEGGPVEWEE